MDENNLDSLLDELSSMDGELNENIDIDSGVMSMQMIWMTFLSMNWII